jgi:CRP-like cAMP-binding protein
MSQREGSSDHANHWDIADYWPFTELPESAGKLLSDAALSFELEDGQWLFHEGDPADALFVLVVGELDIFQAQQWRKRLEAGACIGELPLVVGGQRVRSGAVRAVGRCRLLGLSYSDVRRLLTRRVFDALLTPVTQRHLEQLESGLANLFGKLSLPLLVEIESSMVQRHLKIGEVLFERGDSLEHVWLVDEGRLEVLLDRDLGGARGLQRVAELGPGQPVGELAVLVGGERSATVRALRDTWLRGLSAANFEALLMRHPHAALGLAKTLARRLMRANQQPVVISRPRTMVLLPTDAEVDLRGFVDALVEHMEGNVAVLGASNFVADAPTAAELSDDPSIRRFGTWLSRAEGDHDAVVLLVQPEPDGWTRACVGAADEIVLVGRSDSDPKLNAVERGLEAGEFPGEVGSLVLCHPPGTPVVEDDGALGPWVQLRPKLVFLHRVVLGDRRDLARLGRGLFRA